MIDVTAKFFGDVLLSLIRTFGEKLVTVDEGNELAELCGEIERLYKALPDLETEEGK